MSLPPTPSGYDSWNSYIAEQGAIISAAQGLTLQQGKGSAKLLYAAMPSRQDPTSTDYMPYNVFTTWDDRTVAPTIGRPWRDGTSVTSGSIFIPDITSRITLTPGIIVGGTPTTPFTMEGWFYSTVNLGTNSGPVLLSTNTGSGTPAYYKALTVNVSSSTQIIVDSNGAAARAFDFAETMLINTWYYVAVTRDTSGFIEVWMGKFGDATATASTGGRYDTSGNAAWDLTGLSNCIGAFVPANRYTTGYVSNLRVDNSNLYATTLPTIPVPTAPFAEIASTVFLQNDDTLTDQTGNQTLSAVGTATGDTLSPFI